MKRILAILCVIACLCGLCVPAMAAGTVTVHAYVPSDWNSPNCYTWLSSESNPNWPGDAMTSEGDGWWSFNIAANQDRVIINNGSGSPQTVDITIEPGKEVWIKVLSNTNGEGKHEYEIGYSKDSISAPSQNPGGSTPSTGVDLSGLNSLALVGDGMPGFVEGWNPGAAAGDMIKESAGVYTKVVTVLAGTDAKFKIAGNDEWNDAYNFGGAEDGVSVVLGTKITLTNGGGSKDISLKVNKDCNLKFTVDLNEMTVLVEETTEEAGTTPPPSDPGTSEPTGETYTVYAKVPEDWKTPAVWCWDGNASNPSDIGAWPGSYYMTQGADGWWTIEIPVGYTNVLINANGGAVQTPDITGLSGQDVWINALTDPSNPVFKYEEITDIAPPAETEAPTAPPRETNPPTEPAGNTEAKGGKDLTVLLSVIGSVVIIAVAVVIFVIAKGKKKAA